MFKAQYVSVMLILVTLTKASPDYGGSDSYSGSDYDYGGYDSYYDSNYDSSKPSKPIGFFEKMFIGFIFILIVGGSIYGEKKEQQKRSLGL